MAAAACTSDFKLLTRTADYPKPFGCSRDREARPRHGRFRPGLESWQTVLSLPGGTSMSTPSPSSTRPPLGFLVLVHDLSFAERREAKSRQFLLLAFGFLALAASAVTMVAARLSWRGWSRELRRFIRGGTHRPEFQPILRDVRDLVDRIVAEKEADREGGDWTPQRLRQTLNRHLHGEKVVILANREPYIHERAAGRPISSWCTPPAVWSLRSSRSCGPARESGSPMAAARPTARRPTATAGYACPRGEESYSSAECGCRRRRKKATTTASPTRVSGLSATSPTLGPSSAARTGGTTRP